jgi:predicted AlkP superfamily pyrophosphatase or phosphodiesterase
MKNLLIISICIFSLFSVRGQQTDSPKLIVGIVIDQMCYDYLYRYQSKFSENGFKLIMEKGTNCRNTQYNYVPTFTGPGHASIYTGTTPNNHGIIANDWFERESGTVLNCVDDNSVQAVGTTSNEGLCSPEHLKTNTITDQLKLTYPTAKVISMSIKDRGAILPGGHMSDGSYWFDYSSGRFVTSSFFEPLLPTWVSDFNAKKFPDLYMQQTWNTLLDIALYCESGPDDSPYEHLLVGKTKPTFPYDLKSMNSGTTNFEMFTETPFANTFLTDFAINSLKAENLGTDGQTDMLCISYSTPDIAGHTFGPYSVELEDIYLRLDLEIARLIRQLEEQVGKDGFVLFLTADHAVVPVPQYLIDKNLPGGYVFLSEYMVQLENEVKVKFGHDLILSEKNLNIYLDHKRIDSLKLSKMDVADFVASKVEKWENVKRVFTAEQLTSSSTDDEWRDMVRLGYHSRESGDVLFILEPGFLPKSADSETARKGTSHGSAFNYDTHVPLLWYGKNIPRQEVFRSINITDISATLTHLLYLQRAGAMTGEPIVELLDKED